MRHLCPTCQRRFDERGFCPFDGTALTPGDVLNHPTIVSGPLPRITAPDVPGSTEVIEHGADGEANPANDDAASTLIEPQPSFQGLELRRRTIPLTPGPSAPSGEPRTRHGTGPDRARTPSEPHKLAARSAADNPSDALELLRATRDDEYDKLVGQTLDGRYLVERKIGEGGMGVVFSARHTVIERPLAIKVLKREAMRDAATIRRFVQEAQAASRIGHPNIVDVTDFGTTPDGMTYSVMEYVPGQTLGAAIRHGAPFAPARAMRIGAQIARALAAAHDKGIVHRDLKPENVFLLDRDGRPDFVKIVDFGIAKVSPPSGRAAGPRLTRAGSVFGTPEYMAPEQAAGRSDTDGRVDIYALGVILYEMLCARVPHRGDSMVRTLAMQMLDPTEPPSRVRPDLHIPPDLEAVVLHALVKKREQRFQTMGDLLDALDALLPHAVGQSVTGSPVYTLVAMPGADPGVQPAMPAMPLQMAPVAPSPTDVISSHPGDLTDPGGVRPAGPVSTPPLTRRVKDEPVFTAGERPVSFEHVFTDEHVRPTQRRAWPLLLLFSLIGGGAIGAIALVLTSRSHAIAPAPRDAGVDAAIVALPGDAGHEPREPLDANDPAIDAALDAAIDAPDLIVVVEDAGVVTRVPIGMRRDAGLLAVPETPNRRGTIMVQVLTKPEGANLFEGTTYRGPGGAVLEEPLGHTLTITCRQAGYKPGTVDIKFDGATEAVLCVLKRVKICIDNVKNPFDDCEIDPNAPTPTPTPMP